MEQYTKEKVDPLFSVIEYKFKHLEGFPFFNSDKIDLFTYVINEIIEISNKPIPFYTSINHYEDWYWFESFTGNNSSDIYTWEIGVMHWKK